MTYSGELSRRTLQFEQDVQTASLISACRNRIETCPWVSSPGRKPISLIRTLSKPLLRRPFSLETNSARGASPEHLAFPLHPHPWDLFRNNPQARERKALSPNKTSFAELFLTGQSRGKNLGPGLRALPLVKMAAIGGAAPSGNPRVARPTRTIHAEPSTPAEA